MNRFDTFEFNYNIEVSPEARILFEPCMSKFLKNEKYYLEDHNPIIDHLVTYQGADYTRWIVYNLSFEYERDYADDHQVENAMKERLHEEFPLADELTLLHTKTHKDLNHFEDLGQFYNRVKRTNSYVYSGVEYQKLMDAEPHLFL